MNIGSSSQNSCLSFYIEPQTPFSLCDLCQHPSSFVPECIHLALKSVGVELYILMRSTLVSDYLGQLAFFWASSCNLP